MHWRIRLGYQFPHGKYFYEHRGLAHLAQQLQRFSPDDPEERCGLLIGIPWSSLPVSLREVPNTHPSPAERFRISQAAYDSVTAVVGPRRSVVGTIHTHPGRDRDGWFPSADDLAGPVKQPGFFHAVYHPYTRRFTTYDEAGIRSTFHIR